MEQDVWEDRLEKLFGSQAYHEIDPTEFGSRLEAEAGVDRTLRISFQYMDDKHRQGLLKDLHRLTKKRLGPPERLLVYKSMAKRFDQLFSWEEVPEPGGEAPPLCGG